MKKILLIFLITILGSAAYSQTILKKGVIIGNNKTGSDIMLVDSLTQDGSVYKIYNGATEVLPLDTATMLCNYLLDSETAAAVTGFTLAGGSLTLSGADAITFTTTAATSVTLPTTGTLATTIDLVDYLFAADTTYLSARVDSIVSVLADTTNIETLMQIDFDTDTIADLSELKALENTINNTEELSDLAPMLVDTIPLMVFGGGGNQAGDTAVFSTSSIYGSFYNAGSDSLKITELRVIMLGDATDTLSVDILWDVNLNDGTPTELNADPLPVNSFTTGDTDTSFGTAKIPPGVWVWCETPGVVAGRKPTYFNAQISGYKIPRY